jgi:pimeloyl-ACP methyl ester carboxylesterase
VPGVACFRDPAVAAAISTEDALFARRQSVIKALARLANEAEIAEYLDPWTDPRVAQSWRALTGAADNRYPLELLLGLRQSGRPKKLVWGEDDVFQTIDYAEIFAAEISASRLVRIRSAGDIPLENNPRGVAAAPAGLFARR